MFGSHFHRVASCRTRFGRVASPCSEVLEELWEGRRATAGPNLKIVAKSLVNVNVISLSTW
jgi:hypothetical protein